ncbi:MAG: hypothetical protein L6R36_006928 [Xanthoria steineri]|nr:MAG: hypothetical protein L6R36_006928 [Xanthoria steineri]
MYMPLPPIPASTRPTTMACMFGAAPHRAEPAMKRRIDKQYKSLPAHEEAGHWLKSGNQSDAEFASHPTDSHGSLFADPRSFTMDWENR